MRLFVSVDLDGLADEVAAIQSDLAEASGLSLTDPSQAHVTLKFLGEVERSRLPELRDALAAAVDDAGVEPFEATFGGLGVFPSIEYITVVWLGVREGAGAAELIRLHETIEARTTAIGFDPEDHEFTPHATLARMEHAGGKERVQQLVRGTDPDAGTMVVSDVRLTESTLGPGGPVYETVDRFSL